MRPRPFAKMIKREYDLEISEKDLNAEMAQEGLDADDDLADVKEELSREGIIVSASFKITPDEADWLLERRKAIAEGWETLPKGWTMESVKKFWNTLTGDRKHKITKCMKEMEGKVENTGAFCASLARKLGVASMEDDMSFKITAEEKRLILKRRKTKGASEYDNEFKQTMDSVSYGLKKLADSFEDDWDSLYEEAEEDGSEFTPRQISQVKKILTGLKSLQKLASKKV